MATDDQHERATQACAAPDTWLGDAPESAPPSPVTLTDDDLAGGCYVAGTVSDLQTTLLTNMLVQWAHAGYGFCYVHPSDLVPLDLLYKLPRDRLDDVLWIDLYRDQLHDALGVDRSHRITVNPLVTAEAGVEAGDLVTSPVSGRTADLIEVLSENRQFNWNVGALWAALVPVAIAAADLTVIDLSKAVSRAQLDDEPATVRTWIPHLDDATDTAIRQAWDRDPEVFRDAMASINPLTDTWVHGITFTRDAPCSVVDAVDRNDIILVTGDVLTDTPTFGMEEHALRSTQLLAATVVRRVWEALQRSSAQRPIYPVVLDGITRLFAGEAAVLRELVTHHADTRAAPVVAGPAAKQLPDALQFAVQDHLGVDIWFEHDADDAITTSLFSRDLTTAERAFDAAEHDAVAPAPLCWVDTAAANSSMAGTGDVRRSLVRMTPYEPFPRQRTDEDVAAAIEQSVTRHGVNTRYDELRDHLERDRDER